MKQENPVTGTTLSIKHFYIEQLKKFEKIGINKKTEFGVKITKELIEITKKRLSQISANYETSLSEEGKYSRKRQRKLRKISPLKKK